MGYDYDTLPDRIKEKIDRSDRPKSSSSGSRNDFEHELQVRAKEYMRLQYPELKKKFFAIPNGGARNPITGKKLKAEGVLAGVWDLFLAVPKGVWGGCFIETKWGKNGLTDTQKAFREANRGDYHFFVYRSLDEFIDGIEQYLTENVE